MEQILVLGVVLAVGLFLRLLYARGTSTDQWVSEWLIARQAKKKWVSYDAADSIIKGKYLYPVFMHWIIAKCPKQKRITFGRILNILPDLIVAVALYYAMHVIHPGPSSFVFNVGVVLLFLTQPILLPVSARMKAIKGRALGFLFTTLYFVCLYLTMHNPIYYILVIAAAWLAILTSLFALQVLLFYSILLSLFLMSWIPLVALLFAVCLGICIPALGIREPLIFWIDHKIWYIRNWRAFSKVARRSDILRQLKVPYYLFTKPKEALTIIFNDSPFLIALYSAPAFFALLLWAHLNVDVHAYIHASPLNVYLWSLSLASAVMFVLTSTKWLLFIGQAERYFEYGSPFFILLFTQVAAYQGVLLTAIVAFTLFHLIAIAGIVLFIGGFSSRTSNESDDLLGKTIDHLAKKKSNPIIATLPLKLTFLLGARWPEGKSSQFYYRFISRPKERGYVYFEKDTITTDIFTGTPAELKKKYGINHLVVLNSFLAKAKPHPFIKKVRSMKAHYKNTLYSIYKL